MVVNETPAGFYILKFSTHRGKKASFFFCSNIVCEYMYIWVQCNIRNRENIYE